LRTTIVVKKACKISSGRCLQQNDLPGVRDASIKSYMSVAPLSRCDGCVQCDAFGCSQSSLSKPAPLTSLQGPCGQRHVYQWAPNGGIQPASWSPSLLLSIAGTRIVAGGFRDLRLSAIKARPQGRRTLWAVQQVYCDQV